MQAADDPGEQVSGPVVATTSKQFVMTDRVAELNKSVTELHRENASNNDGKSIAFASDLITEPVGEQAMTEGTLQPTSENYQEQPSIGIDKDAEGLLADKLDKQTNSVDHSLQHAEEQNQLLNITEGNEISSDYTSSESGLDSSSGSESDDDLRKCFYPTFEALENSRPPEVGMKFPTLEDAQRFYNTHALLTGFAVRRGSNYKRKKFHLLCNRSGKLKATQDLQRKRKSNAMGSQCQAKVIVKLNKEQWEFTTVQNEHNHPLCPSPSLTRFFLNHKYLSTEEKSFLRVLQQSRVHPMKAMKIFKKMRSNYENIPLRKKGAGNLQYVEERRKANSDVEITLKRFKELELRDLCFFYTMQTDEDNIVRSIFWTDARSRMDYEIFGDFISFDTTYSTNRHNMPFVPITGINNHGRTLMFGCALLQDQKAETFKWMFQTFLHVMGGKIPRAIITDQDEGLTKAIADVMPQVRHRFCKCHVMKKAQEKLGAFMVARGNINAELHGLVDNSLTEMEFEEGWAELIERYVASGNDYLQLMWETRKNWVPVYFKADLYPFVKSTVRGEGTNLLFNDNVLCKDRIERFIEQYEKIQEKIVKTDEDDRLQSGTEPSYFSLQPIEKLAAHIYTRQIFLKVQKELLHSTAFNVHEIQGGAVYRIEKVFNYENPEFDRNSFEVLVEAGTNAFECQCAKFTRHGILCCHIFRLFTQLGINEIPGQYIVPRWTHKFRKEKLKQYKEKCLEKTENATRYAMLVSKMADIGKEICIDGAKCSRFMLELEKFQEKIAIKTEENPENNHS